MLKDAERRLLMTERKPEQPEQNERPTDLRRLAKEPVCEDPEMMEDSGAAARRRNMIISVIATIVGILVLAYFLRTGALSDTDKIRQFIQDSGFWAPVLFIAISVFSSYIPIIPMGSMGSIGIVLFGPVTAFFYNYATSVINCTLGYWLARKFGVKMIFRITSPKTYCKYKNWIARTRHFPLIFTICMFLPVSPDILLCMMAGLTGMSFGRFILIILISRPFSSWAYSTGLLKIFDWFRTTLHLG